MQAAALELHLHAGRRACRSRRAAARGRRRAGRPRRRTGGRCRRGQRRACRCAARVAGAAPASACVAAQPFGDRPSSAASGSLRATQCGSGSGCGGSAVPEGRAEAGMKLVLAPARAPARCGLFERRVHAVHCRRGSAIGRRGIGGFTPCSRPWLRAAILAAACREGGTGDSRMLGLMQDQPLLISSLIDFAARHHGDARDRLAPRRGRHPSLHLGARPRARARQVANALDRLKLALSATASPRWPGTATATSSCTSASAAAAACCTPSTRACTRTRSPGSPTTPKTRCCAST